MADEVRLNRTTVIIATKLAKWTTLLSRFLQVVLKFWCKIYFSRLKAKSILKENAYIGCQDNLILMSNANDQERMATGTIFSAFKRSAGPVRKL